MQRVKFFCDTYISGTQLILSKGYEACVMAMEHGHLHVDCVDQNNQTLLLVLVHRQYLHTTFLEPVEASFYYSLLQRVLKLDPGVPKFWEGVRQNQLGISKPSLAFFPEYVWSDLGIVQTMLAQGFGNKLTEKHVREEFECRVAKRFTPFQRQWISRC